MINRIRNIIPLPLMGLILAALISIVWFFVFPKPYERVVLFFPHAIHKTLEGESRPVVYRSNTEDKIRVITQEMLAGSVDMIKIPIFDRSSSLSGVFYNGNTGNLIISINMDVSKNVQNITYPLEDALAALERSIRFNVPQVKEVIFTINGSEIQNFEYEIVEE